LDTHQRQNKKGQAGYGFTVQAGKETIQAVSVFTRFGHHDFIARQQIDILRAMQMLTKEHPEQAGPR
jgi:hypothetical protein